MKKEISPLKDKVLYLGRMVDKLTFRAFVYGADNTQKLAKSWIEFQALVSSGLWFAERPEDRVVEGEVVEEKLALEAPVAEPVPEIKEEPKVEAPVEEPKKAVKKDAGENQKGR